MMMQQNDEQFMERFNQDYAPYFGAIKAITARHSFPLKMQHATEYTKPRLALIGDAAHIVHPLAGLGINLGFKDAMVLGEHIKYAAEHSLPIYSRTHLRQYERQQKTQHWKMIAGLEAIKQTFACDWPGLSKLRGFGLRFINKSLPIKRFFMAQATG